MDTGTLLSKLNKLNTLSSALEISESERSRFVEQLSAYANRFISELPEKKIFHNKKPESLAISNSKKSFIELLDLYHKEVTETGINAASGNHLGYIPAGGIFASALADFLAAVTNPYAGVYYASPGAAEIENEVLNWLKSIFSFPQNSVGNLTSGGSVSTLIAFTAARDKFQIKNEKIRNSVVYISPQVHHSTQKALRIIGLEDIVLRSVPLDAHHRMRVDALNALIEKDIAGGLHPFLLVGTAGTTDTGAMDPLDELADTAERHHLWFHVDAAYGGFFILTSKKELFRGIERADSLIVDPHKGMFIPYGLGAVLIKDRTAVLHSNQYVANYMQDAVTDDLIQSPSNVSPELTKHFRGLRLWLPLQLHGVEPFAACLEEKLLLVKYFRNEAGKLGFLFGPEPDLSISYFWYPFESDADEKNRMLMDEIHDDGEIYFSSSVIDEKFVIRIAVLSFRTKKETIDKAVQMIQRCLKKVQTR